MVASAMTWAIACGHPELHVIDDQRDAASDADAASAQSLCPNGRAVDWPSGPYSATTVIPPDLSFTGPDGPVSLRGYFEPCAAQSRLLVIRTSAAWCGTCGWHIRHTKQVLEGDPRLDGRVILVDLLVADEDNMPATAAAAARWRDQIEAPGPVAADPAYTFAGVLVSESPLPEYVVIDTKTMRVRTVASDPAPESLQGKLAIELAALDGLPRPDVATPPLYDDVLTMPQWDLVREMKAPGAPPADPTNEYGDVAAAAALGKKLFSDTALSPSNTVSCATCHDPGQTFTDGKAQAVGVAVGDRNAPTLALAAHARWQFWDGRADTLWMQALGPFEDAREFGSNRLFIAHSIATRYASEYAAVFGAKYPLPDLGNTQRFPANGKPGDATWTAMAEADRDAVTRVYVNVGKAIAAFERTLRVEPNALDKYADGDKTALSAAEKENLSRFFKVGCAQCHWGPRLTDDAFHVVRFPTGRQDNAPDLGRSAVLTSLATREFVATSKWSDDPQAAKPLVFGDEPSMVGAFKTATLRGITTSGPFSHGGRLTTLEEVARHYGGRGVPPNDPRAAGITERWVPRFDPNVQSTLPTFLKVLSGKPVIP